MKPIHIGYIIALILIIGGIIYQANYSQNKKEALVESDTLTANVFKKSIGRDLITLNVVFLYNNKVLKAEVLISEDTVPLHSKVLLRVAKKAPEKYIDLIKVKRH